MLLFDIVVKILARTNKKKNEAIKIVKQEVQLSMFEGDRILYRKNSTDSTKRLSELIRDQQSSG